MQNVVGSQICCDTDFLFNVFGRSSDACVCRRFKRIKFIACRDFILAKVSFVSMRGGDGFENVELEGQRVRHVRVFGVRAHARAISFYTIFKCGNSTLTKSQYIFTSGRLRCSVQNVLLHSHRRLMWRRVMYLYCDVRHVTWCGYTWVNGPWWVV